MQPMSTVLSPNTERAAAAVDWENGKNVRNASLVLSSVIGALSRELAPSGRTVTLCVASGWLPYLGESAWPAYEEAGVNRLMTMSTCAVALHQRKPEVGDPLMPCSSACRYPLTQPFSMPFEYQVLDQMLRTVRNKDVIGVGLWPKQGLGWTEPEL